MKSNNHKKAKQIYIRRISLGEWVKAFVGFAGFGGVDVALRDCGFNVLGVEIDEDIAQVNRANGGHVITANILDLNPIDFIGYVLAHFSPSCPNFSQAKIRGEESQLDVNLAKWIALFIQVVKPEYFTLENVWAYRNSQSWGIIQHALQDYNVGYWHLNAADYGVPQTRKRMIVMAKKKGQVAKPFPTHLESPDMFSKPWVGWYEAIEDLIPGLSETKPAPWQMEQMPEELKAYLTGQGNYSKSVIKAFIIDSQNASRNPITNRSDNDPMFTVAANVLEKTAGLKAFIVGSQYQTSSGNKQRIVQNKPGDHPIWTITASDKGDTRAFVSGRWVSMTPECLARFQSFPRDFKLPDNRILACKGIGNAVPPLLYKAVLKSLLGDRHVQPKP